MFASIQNLLNSVIKVLKVRYCTIQKAMTKKKYNKCIAYTKLNILRPLNAKCKG